MEVLERIFNVALIAATLRTTAPILLVALGWLGDSLLEVCEERLHSIVVPVSNACD